GLARDRLRAAGERVRRVTRGAGALPGRRGVQDPLGVARGARLGRGVVRRVAIDAPRVLAGGEDALVLLRVAALARGHLLLAERVRLVAAGAPRVPGLERRAGHPGAAGLLLVTARAVRVGEPIGLVHRVAVEAALRAGVVRAGLLLVARGARLGRDRFAVGPMAVAARLIGVRADGRRVALGALVAAHTARRAHGQIGAEAVAVLAPGRRTRRERIDRVERRAGRRVAPL